MKTEVIQTGKTTLADIALFHINMLGFDGSKYFLIREIRKLPGFLPKRQSEPCKDK
ncbi:MAG: hypothetical protein ACK52X_00695 [bacterium]